MARHIPQFSPTGMLLTAAALLSLGCEPRVTGYGGVAYWNGDTPCMDGQLDPKGRHITLWIYDGGGKLCDAHGAVADDDLELLEKWPDLRELYLSGQEITDEGLKHLSSPTNLKVLELNTRQVTDAGLEHLVGLERLLVLKLVDTQVTEQGIERFEEAVPACDVRIERTPAPAGRS